MDQTIDGPAFDTNGDCERILRSLPDWFGIEASLVQYAKDAAGLPTFFCRRGEQVVGFLTIRKHNSFSAEVHVIAISPELHRCGIGKAMLDRVEHWLRSDGTEISESRRSASPRPDADYEETRRFYLAVGFRPLEEFPTLWGGERTPCLQLVKRL